ncbi:phage terminase small subunit P27 family [Melissococcus plutonius]|uniref:phage terminase small subunit P27 family n=1 Tax=Melissococcus plutonius TaxID=33970 RepID=UPI003C2C14F3
MTKELPNLPPDYLGGTARYMWRRLVPLIKENPIVSELDKTMVESFCVNYQTMRLAYESIKEDGAIYTTESGMKKNPAVQVLDLASKNLRSIGAELGLTPASRAKLLESSEDEPDNSSIIESMKEAGFIK